MTQVLHVQLRAERAHADVERCPALVVGDVHVAVRCDEHLQYVRQLPLCCYVDGRLARAVGPATQPTHPVPVRVRPSLGLPSLVVIAG